MIISFGSARGSSFANIPFGSVLTNSFLTIFLIGLGVSGITCLTPPLNSLIICSLANLATSFFLNFNSSFGSLKPNSLAKIPFGFAFLGFGNCISSNFGILILGLGLGLVIVFNITCPLFVVVLTIFLSPFIIGLTNAFSTGVPKAVNNAVSVANTNGEVIICVFTVSPAPKIPLSTIATFSFIGLSMNCSFTSFAIIVLLAICSGWLLVNNTPNPNISFTFVPTAEIIAFTGLSAFSNDSALPLEKNVDTFNPLGASSILASGVFGISTSSIIGVSFILFSLLLLVLSSTNAEGTLTLADSGTTIDLVVPLGIIVLRPPLSCTSISPPFVIVTFFPCLSKVSIILFCCPSIFLWDGGIVSTAFPVLTASLISDSVGVPPPVVKPPEPDGGLIIPVDLTLPVTGSLVSILAACGAALDVSDFFFTIFNYQILLTLC